MLINPLWVLWVKGGVEEEKEASWTSKTEVKTGWPLMYSGIRDKRLIERRDTEKSEATLTTKDAYFTFVYSI